MRYQGWLVLRVDIAEAADAAHSRHTLFEADEAAIGAANTPIVVICAPRIILGFDARRQSHRSANSQEE
jgi:hypothetical protein